MLLIVFGVIAVTTLGGCLACVGVVVLLDKEERSAQKRNVIEDAEGRAVRLGTPEQAVRARFGKPAPAYREQREEAGRNCLFWNIRGGQVGDQWQLCFAGGRLAAKYRWA